MRRDTLYEDKKLQEENSFQHGKIKSRKCQNKIDRFFIKKEIEIIHIKSLHIRLKECKGIFIY